MRVEMGCHGWKLIDMDECHVAQVWQDPAEMIAYEVVVKAASRARFQIL